MYQGRIGIYARVSSQQQAEKETIKSQVDTVEQWIRNHEEKVVLDSRLIFLDEGWSGSTLDRPGLENLRDKAALGDLSIVYVLCPDRLARKYAHQVLLIDELTRAGVAVHFCNRQIGETPEDQMLLQIQGIVAEYEREKIIERTRRGRVYAAKQGKVNVLTGAPYGYKYVATTESEDALYVVNAFEAQAVRKAFDLFTSEGMSIRKVCKQLGVEGFYPRKGGNRWAPSSLVAMLKNTAYMGKASYRKTKKVPRKKDIRSTNTNRSKGNRSHLSIERRPSEDWIFIPVPPIVNKMQFQIAQQRLARNKELSPRNTKYNYLAAGLLRCHECGYALHGVTRGKYAYYRCDGIVAERREAGRVCASHPIKVQIIDELVWTAVSDLLKNPKVLLAQYDDRAKSDKSLDGLEIVRLDQKLKALNVAETKLLDLLEDGLISDGKLKERLQRNRQQYNRLNKQVLETRVAAEEEKRTLRIIDSFHNFSTEIIGQLESADFETRKMLTQSLVNKIVVDTFKEIITIKHIVSYPPKTVHQSDFLSEPGMAEKNKNDHLCSWRINASGSSTHGFAT